MTLPMLILLLLSTPAMADGLSISMQAEARFIYSQTLNGLGENITVLSDVTDQVPYEICGNDLIVL